MKNSLLLSLYCFLLALPTAFSQYKILAGSIHVEQLGDCNSNKIMAKGTIMLRKDNPVASLSDSINIQWGDDVSSKIGINSNILLPGQLSFLSYVGEHTYASPGKYSISMEDCCLTESFINFNSTPPVPFKVSAVFSLLNGQFQGCNSTPELLSHLVDFAYIGQSYQFNPVAYDTEGDSLTYSFFNPLGEFDYLFPDEIMPASTTDFSINPQNGTITWNSPTKVGDYLVGLKMDEFRHQVLISETYHLVDIHTFDFTFSLFPNPTVAELTVMLLPALPEQQLEIRIYNTLGQLVQKESGVFTSTGYQLNVHDFANGLYILELETLGQTWVKQFVKH